MSLENTTDIHWLNYLNNIRSPDFQNRHGVGSFKATSCFSLSFQGLTRKCTPQLSVTMGWALVNRPTWQTPLNHVISQPNHPWDWCGNWQETPPPSVKMRKSHGFQWWNPVKALYFMGKTRENPMVSYWFPRDFPVTGNPWVSARGSVGHNVTSQSIDIQPKQSGVPVFHVVSWFRLI